jgi:hypothetical protein
MPALQLLIVDFVVAGFAAGAAVVEAVFPEADIELSLAKTAVFIALAAFFNLFALATTGLGLGRHRETLAPRGRAGNVPLVTWNRGQALGFGPAGPMLRSGMMEWNTLRAGSRRRSAIASLRWDGRDLRLINGEPKAWRSAARV